MEIRIKAFGETTESPLETPPAGYVAREEMEEKLAIQREVFERRIYELETALGMSPPPPPSPLRILGRRIRGSARLTAASIAAFIGAWLIIVSWPGLMIGFDGDDVMNLHQAWHPPFGDFVIANLIPFTTFYRPTGALYYRLCLALFGWHPHAFRFVTYGLMLTNLLLIYLVTKRLSKSAETGALAALLFVFHGRLRPIYVSNGTVYDVLCLTFSLLALWYYVRMRESRRAAGLGSYALATWLFIAAINAKEMAAILPAVLLLYEWIYHSPDSWRPAALAKWLRKRGTFSFAMLALAILAFWAKRRPGSLLYGNELYKPEFTVRMFFGNERKFLTELFFLKPEGVNTTGVVLFYAGLFFAAWLTRRKQLWLLAWFALLAPLPVIFIPYRGMYELYVPLAGFAMYLACVAVPVRDWLLRTLFKRQVRTGRTWVPERVVLFALAAFAIPFTKNRDMLSTINVTDPVVHYTAAYHDALLRLNEPLPENARILLLKCQYPDDDWGPLMLTRELYRDRELWIDRPAMMKEPIHPESYDRIIDFDGTNLVVTQRNPPRPMNGAPPPVHKPSD